MPAATPSGTAAIAVTSMTSSVPTQAERMPACAGAARGEVGEEIERQRSEPDRHVGDQQATITSRATPDRRCRAP
jgi:hypothetical protein